jgi:putative hydrolase
MRIDFHTHSLLSDGELIPSELARRAEEIGHQAIAITDHVDSSNLGSVIKSIVKVAEDLNRHMKIYVIPGVEITHVPVPMISGLAKQARKLGAKLVVVHGETPIEPVYRGTNDAALSSGEVDILAHPGWLTPKQAEQARDADIYLELTSRTGHCLANGWVARVGTEAKAKLLVNTDAHSPEDLLTLEKARVVARGAGLDEEGVQKAVLKNPQELLKKIRGK